MLSDDNNDDGSEIAAIKNQLSTLLIALIVISGTFAVYLYRQTSMAGKDLAQADKVVANLKKNETDITVFVNKLIVFGGKHPDYAPVLKKYGLTPGVPLTPPPAPK